MELDKIKGYRLTEIQKTGKRIKLLFSRQGVKGKIMISFEGLLFETPSSVINKKLSRAELNQILGFKAVTELRHQNLNPMEYKQLFLEMEGSNENYKLEILCVFKNHRITRVEKETGAKTG